MTQAQGCSGRIAAAGAGATGAAAESASATLAAGRRAVEAPATALDAADALTDARRVPLEELVDSVDARAAEEMGEAGTVMRAEDLPELTRCADTAEQLGALRETLRVDATGATSGATSRGGGRLEGIRARRRRLDASRKRRGRAARNRPFLSRPRRERAPGSSPPRRPVGPGTGDAARAPRGRRPSASVGGAGVRLSRGLSQTARTSQSLLQHLQSRHPQ